MPGKRPIPPLVTIQIMLPNGCFIDISKVALIEAIGKESSITRASRALGVTYKRCWLGVNSLNCAFLTPLILTYPGRKDIGAVVTPLGYKILAIYRSIDRNASQAANPSLREILEALDWSFVSKTNNPHRTPPCSSAPSPRRVSRET